MKLLRTITGEGYQSPVWEADDEHVFFIGNMDIDSDAGSNPDGDKYWQAQTSLKLRGESINADKVKGCVVPGWLPAAVKGIVLGCICRITNLATGDKCIAVCHDTGPLNKDGEVTPPVARNLGVNPNAVNGGEDRPIFLYEIWPGVAALVDGIQYVLQPS